MAARETPTAIPPAPPPIARVTLPDGMQPALNTEQASAYTGLAATTLEGLRCRGGGPRFVRYSRKAVRYRISTSTRG